LKAKQLPLFTFVHLIQLVSDQTKANWSQSARQTISGAVQAQLGLSRCMPFQPKPTEKHVILTFFGAWSQHKGKKWRWNN